MLSSRIMLMQPHHVDAAPAPRFKKMMQLQLRLFPLAYSLDTVHSTKIK
jgi:hypothetical protein